jgi:hypothetical protein
MAQARYIYKNHDHRLRAGLESVAFAGQSVPDRDYDAGRDLFKCCNGIPRA